MPIHNFIRGLNDKPRATLSFEQIITSRPDLSGEVIYGYPLHRHDGQLHIVDAVLVSDQGHVAIVDLVEGDDPGNYQARQDRSYNLVDLRLRQNPDFRDRRTLTVPIQTLTYGPELDQNMDDPVYPVVNAQGLAQYLEKCQKENTAHPNRTGEMVVTQILTAH